MSLPLLFFLGAISANLVVGLGLGIEETLVSVRSARAAFAAALGVLVSALAGWMLMRYVLEPLGLGFLKNIVLIPLVGAAGFASFRLIPGLATESAGRKGPGARAAPALMLYGTLGYGLAFLALAVAQDFASAAFVSVGGVSGFLVAIGLLRGIDLRARIEEPPAPFEGNALLLLSAGFLGAILVLVSSAVYYRSLW